MAAASDCCCGVVDLLAVVAGLALVLVSASDAVSTLVTTRRRRGRHWPTQVFYRRTWRAWVALGRRAQPELREGSWPCTARCRCWACW